MSERLKLQAQKIAQKIIELKRIPIYKMQDQKAMAEEIITDTQTLVGEMVGTISVLEVDVQKLKGALEGLGVKL